MSRPRLRRTLSALATLAVASTTLTGCFEESSPHDALRDFLVGWQTGDYELAARRTDGDEAAVRKTLSDVKLELDAASFRFKIKNVTLNGDEAKADFRAEVDLGENSPLWGYDGVLPLHLVDGLWKVRWSPSVIHPQLKEGQRFAVDPEAIPRQPINDRNGDSLQSPQVLYVAGVVPSQLGAQAEEVVQRLAQITGFPHDRLLNRIRSSPPNRMVPLAHFGRTRYLVLKDRLAQIEQLTVQPQPQPLAPKEPKDLVGKVSAITPEDEQKLGGPQRAGDSIGQSGLQKAYQDYLTGSTQTKVVILDAKTGKDVAVLKEWPGRANQSVKTTIDSAVQQAADQAVEQSRTSALVAVDKATGEIRAVATSGMNQEKDALAGKFPAGTTFSIIATDALVKGNVSPKLRLACPAERTVGGARFVEAGQAAGVSEPAPTLTENFARGCVTALASLARLVDAGALAQSAKAFGIGQSWQLPLKSFSGSVGELGSDADKAKAIAGESVQMSPLSMALVAAAVGSGTWRPPVLVTDPKSPDPTGEIAPAPTPQPVPLDPKVRATLTAMMQAGAKGSPAQAGRGQVYGVSAAAGDESSRQRWFVGWQGDLAIAVLAKNYNPAAIAGDFFGALRDQG
ncbi:penicillin-binding transpeptidase domain-containing protein [Nonomuraea roseoviolacea]|uniref:Cell division protein FtsI/penicillin-binding protein 2 n=1 Tax=Nonomuraea roseoviolacea subsp. carminata TaxID=160689 RepID=A0ABT1JVK1_9ACTN|nr:penicillin-binding transpeptidase domain-containing protein [Nonomuraea roseoviolacea]MCP2345776.1 cell division protein FtsI/penicillin-binding protein 2 [Nonomuraea roseoviolacea subsp. carminata]